MKKLDTAITSFRMDSIDPSFHTDDRQRCAMLADALEEIRDLLTADKQPHTEEQSATFQPWHDVVEIVGPDAADDNGCIGFEGFVTHYDVDNYLRVQLGEDGRWSYFPAASLRLVYRLKPRAQAEPETKFKRGDIVRNIFDIMEYTYEVMQDTNGPQVQLRDCKTGQPRAYAADDLRKIDPPAPFQVGDWVRHKHSGVTFKIGSVAGEQIYGVGEDGATYATLQEFVEKIDPPAQRFTFGQRVRIEWGEIDHLFLGYDHYGTYGYVIGPDKNIHTIPVGLISNPPLDELPF